MVKKNIKKEEEIHKTKMGGEIIPKTLYFEEPKLLSTISQDQALFLNEKDDKIKNMKIYKIILAFVTGVILTVFVYQAVTIYQLRSQVALDHANLNTVVNFLNTQIQASEASNSPQSSQKSSESSSKNE